MKTYINPTLGEVKCERLSDSNISPTLRSFLSGNGYRWLAHVDQTIVPVTDEVFENNFTARAEQPANV